MDNTSIQKSIKKTVLVKRNSEKIVVNIPFDKVYEAITNKETIKIGKEHVIRTSAINEYYWYNCTDEIEIRVTVNFPEIEQKVMAMIADREKAWLPVNKAIVGNLVEAINKKD